MLEFSVTAQDNCYVWRLTAVPDAEMSVKPIGIQHLYWCWSIARQERNNTRTHIYIYIYIIVCTYPVKHEQLLCLKMSYYISVWKDAVAGSHICTCIHTCIHAYIHTYIHTYTCTYLRTCMRIYMHTFLHASTHTCMHTHMHTSIHALHYVT